ncbi:Asp-tRNA(Asn)/Glu-tRNA(Gln) amidotransferase subunit GatA [Selenomonas artemidis]|uniref:Asp-tRNA(Asn)/Glu-tRNA(Gln) amidotransferase subunit GatA n=1 Tax=Selenomonas artemidis TaxID=671224 RepID=UPI0023F09373|nr:Asp-tRNA(Asn)/Glu-tRNA(Gln) amidotransferase subunit GatA [Selenomonas artemidis]
MHLYEKPAHVLHDMLTRGEISARELTEDVLARMDAVEPQIGAYLLETRETALAQADAVDAKIAEKEEIPFLAGIPGAVKDNICTKGVRTTAASKILENFVPPYDATVVTKLRDAAAVVLGKANMDEFAMGGSTENSAYRPTHNPWDTARVPGGSSGGSAAAVAAGTAIWALGSDTGGSIRQPASFCGIVGLKPTYGRVSRYGLIAYASSLDQIGPLTRDVTDAAYLLNIIAGHDAMDSTASKSSVPDYTKALTQDVKALKIGLPKEYFIPGMDAEVETAVRKAIHDFESMGAEVREISLPHTDYAVSTYYLIAPAEAATNLERYDGVSYGARVDGEDLVDMMTRTRTEKFGAEVRRRILIGNYALSAGYYDAYYLKALKVRTLIREDFTRAFENVDVIMTPTAPTTAYRIGEMENPLQMYLQDISTVPVNLAGLPGISVPCGCSTAGLPIGLQIIGKPLAEETILRAAFAYEQAHDYHTKLAPIGGNA